MCGYFLKPKGVHKQKGLGNTKLAGDAWYLSSLGLQFKKYT
jgi:hypothetical protein